MVGMLVLYNERERNVQERKIMLLYRIECLHMVSNQIESCVRSQTSDRKQAATPMSIEKPLYQFLYINFAELKCLLIGTLLCDPCIKYFQPSLFFRYAYNFQRKAQIQPSTLTSLTPLIIKYCLSK